jgi:cytochrome b
MIDYAKGIVSGRAIGEPAGHNPLGGWSVVAMLSALAVQVITGLFLVQEDYAFEGPLARHVSGAVSDRLDSIHEANFWVIAALVALHLAAIAWYTLVKRQELVRAMVTGTKRLAPGAQDSRGGGLATAAAIAIAAGAAVWTLLGRA